MLPPSEKSFYSSLCKQNLEFLWTTLLKFYVYPSVNWSIYTLLLSFNNVICFDRIRLTGNSKSHKGNAKFGRLSALHYLSSVYLLSHVSDQTKNLD
jgi:hypothetical protein